MSTTITLKDEDNSLYECMVLLPMTLSDKEQKEAEKSIDALFAESKATIHDTKKWGRRGLAYKIKGHMEGKYVVYVFEVAPANIKDFDAALRLEKSVLRHLLIKVDSPYEVRDFAEEFQKWLQERDQEEEDIKQEEEEELKRKIVKRASKPKKAPPEKKPEATGEEGGAKLDDKLEELISDEDLNL